MAHQHH